MTDTPADEAPTAVRYLLTGRVQGVGFRHFTRTRARQLGVRGTVANLPDGRVEIHAAADSDTLARFEQEIRQGPPAGRVDDVERTPAEDAGWDGFRVVFR